MFFSKASWTNNKTVNILKADIVKEPKLFFELAYVFLCCCRKFMEDIIYFLKFQTHTDISGKLCLGFSYRNRMFYRFKNRILSSSQKSSSATKGCEHQIWWKTQNLVSENVSRVQKIHKNNNQRPKVQKSGMTLFYWYASNHEFYYVPYWSFILLWLTSLVFLCFDYFFAKLRFNVVVTSFMVDNNGVQSLVKSKMNYNYFFVCTSFM